MMQIRRGKTSGLGKACKQSSGGGEGNDGSFVHGGGGGLGAKPELDLRIQPTSIISSYSTEPALTSIPGLTSLLHGGGRGRKTFPGVLE